MTDVGWCCKSRSSKPKKQNCPSLTLHHVDTGIPGNWKFTLIFVSLPVALSLSLMIYLLFCSALCSLLCCLLYVKGSMSDTKTKLIKILFPIFYVWESGGLLVNTWHLWKYLPRQKSLQRGHFSWHTPVLWFPSPAFPLHIQEDLILIKTNTQSRGISHFVEISGKAAGDWGFMSEVVVVLYRPEGKRGEKEGGKIQTCIGDAFKERSCMFPKGIFHLVQTLTHYRYRLEGSCYTDQHVQNTVISY